MKFVLKRVHFLALIFGLMISNSVSAGSPGSYFSLTAPTLTNGQFQFLFWLDSGRPCVIESSTDLANWTPVATNSDMGYPRIITMDVSNQIGFYRASVPLMPLIGYAIATVENLTLNSSGQITDSFNSSDTNFSTAGQYDSTKASTNGNIASQQGIVNLGGHTIGGNLYLGALASLTSSPSQVLGTVYLNQNLNFPDVLSPPGPALAPPIIKSTNVISQSGLYFISNSLPIDVSAGAQPTLMITASNFTLNLRIHGVGTNMSRVIIYLCGSSATILNIESVDAPLIARNLVISGLPSLTSIIMQRSNFTGAIYAPEAAFTWLGGGANIDFQGSLIVKSVSVGGHYRFHFDEDLVTGGPKSFHVNSP